jgi:hypothetical protein
MTALGLTQGVEARRRRRAVAGSEFVPLNLPPITLSVSLGLHRRRGRGRRELR